MEAGRAYIRPERCVGCGACIPACPVHAIQMRAGRESEVDTAKCIGCGSCAALCHRGAPILSRREKENQWVRKQL